MLRRRTVNAAGSGLLRAPQLSGWRIRFTIAYPRRFSTVPESSCRNTAMTSKRVIQGIDETRRYDPLDNAPHSMHE